MKIQFKSSILSTALLFSITLFAYTINAENIVSASELAQIENRVNTMGAKELNQRFQSLQKERQNLSNQLESTQSPSSVKNISERIGLIDAELSAIQKALLAVVGAAALSSIAGGSSSPDTVPPVININGAASVTVELGDTYTDAGATASDANDGDLTVTTTSNVDTTSVGSYTVTYTATDLSGNTASRIRTVEVVDTTAPVITLVGDATVNVELGGTYTDAGATATDLSGDIVVTSTGTVDTDTVDTYTITYTASDASGNEATAVTRTVNVVDTTAPVITLVGDATVNVELGGTYTDAGATATDLSGDIVVTSTGTVDTDTVDTYTITYTASDASGNEATAVTRTVNVVDTTAPVFTSPSTFVVDEGATAVGTVTATDLTTVTLQYQVMI